MIDALVLALVTGNGSVEQVCGGYKEWMPYDENNPIVQVPVERDDAQNINGDFPLMASEQSFEPMELAQVPAELRDKIMGS